MGFEDREGISTLVFGIIGTVIALSALSVAAIQLKRTRRVYGIYEMA